MKNSITKYLVALILIVNSLNAVSQENVAVNNHESANSSVFHSSFEILESDVEIQEFSTITENDLPKNLKEMMENGTAREKEQVLEFVQYHNEVLIPNLNNAVEKRIYELKNPRKFRLRSTSELDDGAKDKSRFVVVSKFDIEALMFNDQIDEITPVLNKTYSDFIDAYGSQIRLKGTFYLYDKEQKIHFAPKDSFDDLLEFLDGFYTKLENKPKQKLTENYLVHVHKSLDKSITQKKDKDKIKKRNGLILGGVLAAGIVSFRALLISALYPNSIF